MISRFFPSLRCAIRSSLQLARFLTAKTMLARVGLRIRSTPPANRRARRIRSLLYPGRSPRCVAGVPVECVSRPFLVAPVLVLATIADCHLSHEPDCIPTGLGVTPSIVVFAPNFRRPYVEQGNLAVEAALAITWPPAPDTSTATALRCSQLNGVTRQANGIWAGSQSRPPSQQPAFGGNFLRQRSPCRAARQM